MALDPRIEKLPKWAKSYIEDLLRKVEDAQVRAAAARYNSGRSDSDTLMDPFDEIPIRLGRGETIRFVTGENPDTLVDYVDVRVERNKFDKPHLVLMAGSGMSIYPQVTNVVRVFTNGR